MTSANCDCIAPSTIRSIPELFEEAKNNGSFLKICAPMVRYSQLPFRLLARKYGCDVAFSPMIVASSFAASEKARAVDFSTCQGDRPLVVQFGATNVDDLVSAAGHVVRIADGIDVNCGCPQKWAIKEGMGSALLQTPELVRDMVLRLKNSFPSGQLDHVVTASIKIRIFSDEKRSVAFAEQMARTGLDFMTIHGRTVAERSNDIPHWNIVKTVNDNALKPAGIPLVVNGAVKSLNEAVEVSKYTDALGVMAAEHLLRNPALFSPENYTTTPACVFSDFLNITKCALIDGEGDKGHNLKFEVYRKHIAELIGGAGCGRRNRRLKEYNQLKTVDEVNQWVLDNMINDVIDSCDTTEIVESS